MPRGEMFTLEIPGLTQVDAEVLKEYSVEYDVECEWGEGLNGITALLRAPSYRSYYVEFVVYLAVVHLEKQEFILKLLNASPYCRECPHKISCGDDSSSCFID